MDAVADNPYHLGSALRLRRESLGLTQAQAAERAGISRQLLVHLEQGHPRAELGRVFALLKALGVRFTIEVAPEPDPAAAAELDDLLEGL